MTLKSLDSSQKNRVYEGWHKNGSGVCAHVCVLVCVSEYIHLCARPEEAVKCPSLAVLFL